MSQSAEKDAPAWRPDTMLSASNRVLLALLLRRFRRWDRADQRWLIARLQADATRVTPPEGSDS